MRQEDLERDDGKSQLYRWKNRKWRGELVLKTLHSVVWWTLSVCEVLEEIILIQNETNEPENSFCADKARVSTSRLLPLQPDGQSFAPFCHHWSLEFPYECPAHAKSGKIETKPEHLCTWRPHTGAANSCSADASSITELFIQAGNHFYPPLLRLPFQLNTFFNPPLCATSRRIWTVAPHSRFSLCTKVTRNGIKMQPFAFNSRLN